DQAQLWRCTDCFGQPVYCRTCTLDAHRYLPFHRIESWQQPSTLGKVIAENFAEAAPKRFGFFQRTSLYHLGLSVGLGHDGNSCPRTASTFELNILDVSGQHVIRFSDCLCNSRERWELLLNSQIYPATEIDPRTGFTFRVLEHQQTSNLRGKTSLHEYYQMLV
ncbi:hypothetical protein M407DRAFT_49548, partial [Tulasnella calospora MUT 4182]